MQVGSKAASFAGKQASHAGGWLWNQTSKTTSTLVSKATERISSTVVQHYAKDQTTSTMMERNAATKVKQSMGQGWTKSRNLIIGWSLAAIAVYGVATTVPKEIVHYYLKKDDDDKQQRASS